MAWWHPPDTPEDARVEQNALQNKVTRELSRPVTSFSCHDTAPECRNSVWDKCAVTDRPMVVAGNGTSITQLEPGRILASDFIIRTNNFYFEPRYFLGPRVDMAFIAGDPRVARFMFETLHLCQSDYDLRGWTSHNPRVVHAGRYRFDRLYKPMRYRDAAIEAQVKALIAEHNKLPTTGIYAVLAAHGMGAREIILAGIDLYTTSRRYPFEPGPHYRDLMGWDLNRRGLDTSLHGHALDRDILKALLSRGDLKLMTATESPTLADLVEPAPFREGQPIDQSVRPNPPTDWPGRSGLYPIALLKLLRKGSSLWRRMRRTA